jgi:hypothetical protein
MSVQVIRVPTKVASSEYDAEGTLLYVNEHLVAVLACLAPDTGHEPELWHRWFLEAGFGPCADPPRGTMFETLEAAEAWVMQKMGKARPLAWRGPYPIPRAEDRIRSL